MSNHVRLIAEKIELNLSDIIRDFKSYTIKVLFKVITEIAESKLKLVLLNFKQASEKNNNNTKL